jgi:hypothetical protein
MTDADFVAVPDRTIGKRRTGLMSKHNIGFCARRKLAMTADEVRMEMRLDNVLYLETVGPRFLNVLIDVPLRIDHGSLSI